MISNFKIFLNLQAIHMNTESIYRIYIKLLTFELKKKKVYLLQ